MKTEGVAVVSVTLEALATSGVAGSGDVGDSAEMSVSAGSTTGAAAGGAAAGGAAAGGAAAGGAAAGGAAAGGAAMGGAATGAREASIELSLTRLEDSVPQPPIPRPRIATTTTTGHTPELERTVSPRSLGQVNVSERTRLSLFAHGAESSLKSPVTPDLFRLSIDRLGGPSADFPAAICHWRALSARTIDGAR